jgi:hypothetical protein
MSWMYMIHMVSIDHRLTCIYCIRGNFHPHDPWTLAQSIFRLTCPPPLQDLNGFIGTSTLGVLTAKFKDLMTPYNQ